MKPSVQEVPIEFKGERITFALAQIEGPSPNGKTRAVAHGKDTLVWSSVDEQRRRKHKAFDYLQFINTNHPEVQIIVFPEYSLPVEEQMIPALAEYAKETGRIVIPGADNVFDDQWRCIQTKCPIVLPKGEIVWVTKRNLSRWEQGLVDQVENAPQPILSWHVGQKKVCLVPYLCLDFLTWPFDPLSDSSNTIINVVSMCSPDMSTFSVYADASLRGPSGRCTVLCNAVGDGSCGLSSVFAATPSGESLAPVLQLSRQRESLLIFSVNCNHLEPRRKTSIRSPSAIHPIRRYEAQRKNGHFAFEATSDIRSERKTERAVLNPSLFAHLDKTMRVVFADVQAYGTLREETIRKHGFECYSVLGQCDLIISHLTKTASDLVFDTAQCLPILLRDTSILSPEKAADNKVVEEFPIFEVRRFHKILGVPVRDTDYDAFDNHSPSEQDVDNLIALGEDWSTPSVSGAVKDRYRERRWILDTTSVRPGTIDAIITIGVGTLHRNVNAVDIFDDSILQTLIDDDRITSVYGGSGPRVNAHYVLRIHCDVRELFEFIDHLHERTVKSRLLLTTRTFVIVRKWSDLSLADRLKEAVLTAKEREFLNRRILPAIELEDRKEFLKQPAEVLKRMIANVRRMIEFYGGDANHTPIIKERKLEKAFIRGIATEKIGDLAGPHDSLQREVESIIVGLVQKLTDADWEEVMLQGRVRKGSVRSKLAYSERIRAALIAVEKKRISAGWFEPLKGLEAKTIAIRNLISHPDNGEVDQVSVGQVLDAVEEYCKFLGAAVLLPKESHPE